MRPPGRTGTVGKEVNGMEAANRQPRQVYITVLTNDRYIPGVRALRRSLRAVKSAHDLVILVPESRAEELRGALERNAVLDGNCTLCVKPNVPAVCPEGVDLGGHYWANTFFKLSAARCTEFAKVILLDSDMLITRNLDHLFDAPSYSAVAAGHCARPEWVKLNSGLMVLEPDEALYARLLESIRPAILRRSREGNHTGDQDVFQEAFPDWEEHEELHLPEIYNCFFKNVRALAEKEAIRPEEIAVLHFIGEEKPWSRGCFTGENVRQCLSLLRHGKSYESRMLARYLRFAAR